MHMLSALAGEVTEHSDKKRRTTEAAAAHEDTPAGVLCVACVLQVAVWCMLCWGVCELVCIGVHLRAQVSVCCAVECAHPTSRQKLLGKLTRAEHTGSTPEQCDHSCTGKAPRGPQRSTRYGCVISHDSISE